MENIRERIVSCAGRVWFCAKELLKWLALAMITGVPCGIIGAAFDLAVEHVTELRTEHTAILFLLPVIGLVIVAFYKAAKLEGVSTDDMIDCVKDGKPIRFWLLPVMFISTVLTHLGGGSAGREGAALQIGGGIGFEAGRLLRLGEKDLPLATLCGMSAVFSALFGTPLTAAIFAMEVISVGVFYYAGLIPCLTAALVGYLVSLLMGVPPTRFAVADPGLDPWTMLLVILLAIGCAVVSILFCRGLQKTGKLAARLLPNPYGRVLVGGALVIVLTLLVGNTNYNGAGMEMVEQAVSGDVEPWAWLWKLLFTAVTIGFGYKGGEVVPSFFVGACFGCVLGGAMGLPAGFGAAIGLVAVFCGAVNCPIASVFLSIELFSTGDVLYFAMACAISYLLSGYCGLYSSQTILYSKMRAEFINIHTNENEEHHG